MTSNIPSNDGKKNITSSILPGGTFTLADDLTLTRMGYGAMQLAGPHVFGPPSDREGALAVLREVVELGIRGLFSKGTILVAFTHPSQASRPAARSGRSDFRLSSSLTGKLYLPNTLMCS